MITKKCKLCGTNFQSLSSRKVLYCSSKCRNGYKNRKACGTLHLFDKDSFSSLPRNLACETCDKEFTHPRFTRFCSRKCRFDFHKEKIYSNLLNRFNNDYKVYLSYKFNEIKSSITSKDKRKSLPSEFTITKQDIIDCWERQNGICLLTGFKMTHSKGNGYQSLAASVDRIDNSRGYIKGNIRLVCRLANQMRFNLNDTDFKSWCQAVVKTLDNK